MNGMMTRRWGIQALWVLPLVVLLSVVAARTGWGRDRIEPQGVAGEGYDGETLYRGLFFGQGPVAKLFPEIWEQYGTEQAPARSREVGEAIAAEEQRVADGIGFHLPGFFDRFAEDVTSGDHSRVQQALRSAADATTDALADGRYEMWGPWVNGMGCDLSVNVITSIVLEGPGPIFVVCLYVLSPRDLRLTAIAKLSKDGGGDLQTDYLIDWATSRLARQTAEDGKP